MMILDRLLASRLRRLSSWYSLVWHSRWSGWTPKSRNP